MGRKETTGTAVLGEALPRQTGSRRRGKVGRENWVFGTPGFMGSSVRGVGGRGLRERAGDYGPRQAFKSLECVLAPAATTNTPHLNNRHLFLTALEAGSPRSRC